MRWRQHPSSTKRGTYWTWDDPTPLVAPAATVNVDRSEPKVVATILGPDGKPLRELLDRDPIGYHRREDEA
jgi:hypothetical protein